MAALGDLATSQPGFWKRFRTGLGAGWEGGGQTSGLAGTGGYGVGALGRLAVGQDWPYAEGVEPAQETAPAMEPGAAGSLAQLGQEQSAGAPPGGEPEEQGISPAANAQREAANRASQPMVEPNQPPPSTGYTPEADLGLAEGKAYRGQKNVENASSLARSVRNIALAAAGGAMAGGAAGGAAGGGSATGVSAGAGEAAAAAPTAGGAAQLTSAQPSAWGNFKGGFGEGFRGGGGAELGGWGRAGGAMGRIAKLAADNQQGGGGGGMMGGGGGGGGGMMGGGMSNPGSSSAGEVANLLDAERRAKVAALGGGGMQPLGRINWFTGGGGGY